MQLSRQLANQLIQLAIQSPTEEVCGLIGGIKGEAHSFYPITNIAPHRATQYQFDQTQQIEVMKVLRENNQTLFAIFHSHPTTEAIPSKADIEQANYPEAIQLILSLNTKGVVEIRGFKIIDQEVEELVLVLS